MFGLGLRHSHHQYVLTNKPKLDFFEVHTENFIASGGASLNFLSRISEHYPLSFHCVGLSLGSISGIDKKHLKNIQNLNDQFKPFLLSDHISWSNSSKGTANDLLPVPYTLDALNVFCDNINQVQDSVGREILIENPSAYLEYKEADMREVDFINKIADKTNCSILLDINNIYVSSKNFDFDPIKYLDELNINKVKEIHLSGHAIYQYKNKEIRIDTHNTNICSKVLELYKYFIQKTPAQIPTLIEWDEDIPEFEILFQEMQKVKNYS